MLQDGSDVYPVTSRHSPQFGCDASVPSNPSNFVPIRNATRKTAGANILKVCRRAFPPFIQALRRTPQRLARSCASNHPGEQAVSFTFR
jgi:hypothetical protein